MTVSYTHLDVYKRQDLECGDDVSARLYDAGGRLAAKARGGRTLKLDVENALLWSPCLLYTSRCV